MSRDLTAGMSTGVQAGELRPILFFEGEFASGTVNLCTAQLGVSWDGKTWAGLGSLISMSNIEENTDITATNVTVNLSGVDPATVSLAIDEARQNLPGKVWVGLVDTDGSIIADPYLAFVGRLDVPEITDGQDTCTVSITYENILVDLLRPREWRYTHESQQTLSPGDLGFEYVTTIQDKEIVWGR